MVITTGSNNGPAVKTVRIKDCLNFFFNASPTRTPVHSRSDAPRSARPLPTAPTPHPRPSWRRMLAPARITSACRPEAARIAGAARLGQLRWRATWPLTIGLAAATGLGVLHAYTELVTLGCFLTHHFWISLLQIETFTVKKQSIHLRPPLVPVLMVKTDSRPFTPITCEDLGYLLHFIAGSKSAL